MTTRVVWAHPAGQPHAAACILDVQTYRTFCGMDLMSKVERWSYYQPVQVEEPAYLGTEKGMGGPNPKQACTRCLVRSWPAAMAGQLQFAKVLPAPQLRMEVMG